MAANLANIHIDANGNIPLSELSHRIDKAPRISEGTESGWAAVAKSIREVDEDKIKDYKEDIDTILVFAGLYSAVLSALLAESFTSLQPDPNAIMIKLLSQVVVQTQGYSLTSGHLTSTAPPLNISSVQEFQPSLAAKRVNVLWFASLTLSLISASFGILVKQWLREYLAGEYISPQARLRIRHFRTPGLEHWGVFAIAALLPFILQLALAMFFVGLCFFTLDIHSSIGYTTIPLVAGWALLFLAASFSPALSPRCPYKVPIFKYVMQALRESLFHVARACHGFPDLPEISKWPIASKWSYWSLGYNEEYVASDPRQDVDILVAVDASQSDDRLVLKACSALAETDASSEEILDFVVRAINFRLQAQVARRPFPPMLDLVQLSAQTSTILMDAVAHILAREIRDFPASEPIPWTDIRRDCLFLLFARLPCHLSDQASAVVASCFQSAKPYRVAGTCTLLLAGVPPPQRIPLCLHLQGRLRTVVSYLEAYEMEVTVWQLLVQSCCNCVTIAPGARPCDLSQTVLIKHAEAIPRELRSSTCTLMTTFLLRQVQRGKLWGAWHRAILLFMSTPWSQLRPGEPCEWYPALTEVVRLLVTNPQYAQHFHRHLYESGAYSHAIVLLFQKTFSETREVEPTAATLQHAFSTYIAEKLQMPTLLDGEFYFSLLRFIMSQHPSLEWLVRTFRPLTITLYIPLWRRIWAPLHTALRGFDPALRRDTHTSWALACLRAIDTLDELCAPLGPPGQEGVKPQNNFEQWAQEFDTRHSFFDDDIVEDLMLLHGPSNDLENASWRVRRVMWKQRPPVPLQLTQPGTPDSTQGGGNPQHVCTNADTDGPLAASGSNAYIPTSPAIPQDAPATMRHSSSSPGSYPAFPVPVFSPPPSSGAIHVPVQL